MRTVLLLLAASMLGCRPGLVEVVGTRDLGPIEQNPTIRGRDGGYSGTFGDRSVWVYGDSILDAPGEDGSSWRHNTWSWTNDLRGADGLSGFVEPLDGRGAPREFFVPTAAEAEYNADHAGEDCAEEPCGAREILWPGPVVEDPDRDRVLVGYSKIHGEPGEWNFFGRGAGWAIWPAFDAPPQRPVVAPDEGHPTLLWPGESLTFGSAAVLDGDLLYVFGCAGGVKDCTLGRVPVEALHDRGAWAFWDGGGWVADRQQARPLFTGMDMTSVHRNEALGLWIAVYSEPLSNRVRIRAARQLTGPWSKPHLAFEARAPWREDAVAYSGLGHGELQDGTREYVSYYRETEAWAGEIRLVDVELRGR